jgi:hypothetical protein
MTSKEFMSKKLEEDKENYDSSNMSYCPETEPVEGLNILIHHFLGEDWYVPDPMNTEQIITIAVTKILELYPNRAFAERFKNIWKYIKFEESE